MQALMHADKLPAAPTIHFKTLVAFSPAFHSQEKFSSTGVATHAPTYFWANPAFLTDVNIALLMLTLSQNVVQIGYRALADKTRDYENFNLAFFQSFNINILRIYYC